MKNNIRNSSYCLILVKKKETNAIAKVYKFKIYNSYWFSRGGGGSRISQMGRQPKKGGGESIILRNILQNSMKMKKMRPSEVKNL